MLSRDSILSSNDARTESITIDEWGGEILFRSLTGVERDKLESTAKRYQASREAKSCRLMAEVIVMSAVDDAGEALFTNDDIDILRTKNGNALQRCFNVCSKLSGLDKDVQEDMVKN